MTATEFSITAGFNCSTSSVTYAPTSAPATIELVSMRTYCIGSTILWLMPFDVAAEVLSNTHLSSDYNVVSLAAPEIAEHAAPGQFVMVKAAERLEPLLRRPFSVFEILKNNGRTIGLSILNKRIGPSTSLLFD